MTDDIIDFHLNDSAIIRVTAEVKIELLHCCQNVDMYLLKDNKTYLLSTELLRENMFILKNLLKKALLNQLQLHFSIVQDVGILWNQCLQLKPGLIYKETKEQDFWVGEKYLLSSYGGLATWLYNDAHGNIILHITPVYRDKWIDNDEDDDEEANDRAYEKWMVTKYKPIWTTILPPAIAKAWLVQAEDIFSKLQYTDVYEEDKVDG